MKERLFPCINYICDGKCKLSKECHFWQQMQKCSLYIPNKNVNPIARGNKKKKLAKIKNKEYNKIKKGEWY